MMRVTKQNMFFFYRRQIKRAVKMVSLHQWPPTKSKEEDYATPNKVQTDCQPPSNCSCRCKSPTTTTISPSRRRTMPGLKNCSKWACRLHRAIPGAKQTAGFHLLGCFQIIRGDIPLVSPLQERSLWYVIGCTKEAVTLLKK